MAIFPIFANFVVLKSTNSKLLKNQYSNAEKTCLDKSTSAKGPEFQVSAAYGYQLTNSIQLHLQDLKKNSSFL